MDLKEEEKEQLLQDASTLLMFANVAAKQQQSQQIFSPPPPNIPTASNENMHTELAQHNVNIQRVGSSHYTVSEEQRFVQHPPAFPSVSNEMHNEKHIIKPPVNSFNLQSILHEPHSPPKVPVVETREERKTETPEVKPEPKLTTFNRNEEEDTVKLGHPLRVKSAQPTVEFEEKVSSDTKQLRLNDIGSKAGYPSNVNSPSKFAAHKRSASNPEHSTDSVNRYHHSPGPANVTLAGGINTKNGVRDNNNAMIAAAALAAAADIPLPLKQVSTEFKKSKDEEDQMTEPEDDNRTEDEESKRANIKSVEEETDVEGDTKEQIDDGVPKQVPHIDTYRVDPDSGIIGCVCGIEEDDGFTVQCDICFRWQHCVCMGFETSDEVPEDEYRCYFCDGHGVLKLDPETCRRNTLKRLKAEDTADDKSENGNINNQRTTKRKHSNSSKLEKLEKRKKPKGNIRISKEPLDNVSEQLPDKLNVLLDDGVSAEEYSSVYYKLKTNKLKNSEVQNAIDKIIEDLKASQIDDSMKDGKSNFDLITEDEIARIGLSDPILPNQEKYFEEHKDFSKETSKHNGTSVRVKSYNDNNKSKFSGVTKLGLFISSKDKVSEEENQVIVPHGTPIIEFLGEVDLFSNYIKDPINQYGLFGVTKSKVIKSNLKSQSQSVDVVIDSRFAGNESRFIRKSCPSTANCSIKQLYSETKGSLKFIVCTSKDIILDSTNEFEEELRLTWEWDPDHPIIKLYENDSLKFDSLSSNDKSSLISNIDELLFFNDCGCSTASGGKNCAILKVKKATSYLMRSNRKVSSISNVNLFKSKEDLISPKKPKEYIPWSQRVLERQADIGMKLSVTTNDNKLENSHDVETTVDRQNSTECLKEIINMKFPFKKQYLMKNIPRQISTGKDVQSGLDYLPIPVVPELLLKIEQSIKEKVMTSNPEIEQIAKINKDSIKVDLRQEKVSPVEREAKNAGLVSQPSKVESVETSNGPPVVKKKLSFADYKKKMK